MAPLPCGQHQLAEGAAAPEQPVDIHIHMEAPMLVAGVLGAHVAFGHAGIVDQDIDAAVIAEHVGGGPVDLGGFGDVQR